MVGFNNLVPKWVPKITISKKGKSMKINYIKKDDYLIPKLGITTSTTNSINRYGLLKLNYIKKHKKNYIETY